jgi:hypothetical protein
LSHNHDPSDFLTILTYPRRHAAMLMKLTDRHPTAQRRGGSPRARVRSRPSAAISSRHDPDPRERRPAQSRVPQHPHSGEYRHRGRFPRPRLCAHPVELSSSSRDFGAVNPQIPGDCLRSPKLGVARSNRARVTTFSLGESLGCGVELAAHIASIFGQSRIEPFDDGVGAPLGLKIGKCKIVLFRREAHARTRGV